MDFDRNGRVDLYEFTRAARTWDAEAETSSWMKVFGKGDKNKDRHGQVHRDTKPRSKSVLPPASENGLYVCALNAKWQEVAQGTFTRITHEKWLRIWNTCGQRSICARQGV